MSRMPNGWVTARLADVTEHVSNIKPEDMPTKDFGYVDISSIDNSRFVIADVKHFTGANAPSRARRPIRPNDILFSNVRTYLRNIALVEPDCQAQVCSTGFTVLRPNEAIEPYYLFRYVLTDEFIDAVTPHQTGTHYPATSDRVVMAQQIRLAPLPEQRRIVSQLKQLFHRLGAAQERLANISSILKRFRQSVLATACSGRLTADWRLDNPDIESAGTNLNKNNPDAAVIDNDQVPRSWAMCRLDSVSEVITKGASPKWQGVNYSNSGVLFVTSENVGVGKLLLDTKKYVEPKFNELQKRSILKPGDLLTNIVGASIGRSAIYESKELANINQAVALIRLRPFVNKKYIVSVLNSPAMIDHMHSTKVDVARANLSLKDVGNFPIPLPPLAEQEEIVRRVEELFKTADSIEIRYNKVKAHLDKLSQSILAIAFRGNLVAQDPIDEPADVLLERIRTAEVPKSTKTRSQKKETKMKTPDVSTESVKRVIRRLPDERFSFAELRTVLPGDYNILKEVLFELLAEPEPSLKQVFDKNTQSIRFERIN